MDDVQIPDELAYNTQAISVGAFEIPNCPYVFTSDESAKHRYEDEIIAWGWKMFMETGSNDYEWLIRLPMVKSSYLIMKAVEEFVK